MTVLLGSSLKVQGQSKGRGRRRESLATDQALAGRGKEPQLCHGQTQHPCTGSGEGKQTVG